MDEILLKRWERLSSYKFDQAVEFPMSKRLARDNGWTTEYGCRVLQEYLRFCFLCSVSELPLTPSDEVDQAWHLHLVYSWQYWNDFCPNYLQYELHHGPTKGGQKQKQKFEDCYSRTLGYYQEVFEEMPPADIWPSVRDRFRRGQKHQRVDLKTHWIIPKRAAGVGATLALCGCSSLDDFDPIRWFQTQSNDTQMLIIWLSFLVVVLVVRRILKSFGLIDDGWFDSGCFGCSD